ncbi:MAG: hypothetical protein A2826_02955 [Candidatus Doudnabacteria bacterium RIFCSPHIGHO2_01_FULL_43_23]|uniref:Cell division protein FtsX n=1 Tax=Candidatus Doudnabacteria bacterium RIFCSPHIGHO2_01_FULL_43_23 TaxID=1817822 RepID=A0A1F5NSI3_9BACT|nr:MAG: hypothetical protein A2826_02955 [Candidatus Doudnabacteria bacterium RIFCSPHIGHO2_01_FULL_43_23]
MFKRILKYGFLALVRNGWLTLSAVSVMTITLLVLSTLLVINQLAGLSAQNIQDRVSISVFLSSDTSNEKLLEVKEEFENFEEVKEVRLITAEQALETFKKVHEGDELIEQTLAELEVNPLQPSFVISAKELDLYPVISQKLDRSRFVSLFETVNFEDSRDLIARLNQITKGIRNFGVILIVVFGLVAVLVMFNTLRLTIFSRREEIEIMRLVGASNAFVRGPFIVEGIVYGLLATIIASVVLLPILSSIEPQINSFFGLELGTATFFSSDFWILVLIELGVGITLGVASSLIATKKYLEV